jgi:hypothetical protein
MALRVKVSSQEMIYSSVETILYFCKISRQMKTITPIDTVIKLTGFALVVICTLTLEQSCSVWV